MQTLIVALLVVACTTYAGWTLMPATMRRRIASSLLKLPLPDSFAATMRRAATVSSGCGCDGCDHAPAKATRQTSPQTASKAQQVITFHPRIKR